jgi:hypothetical protein
VCALFASLQLGCPPPGTPQQSTTFSGAKRPELSCAREGAERVDVASWRGTGRPDVARVYKREGFRGPPVLACREVDLNGDGHKDVLVYYDAEGRKLREEFDHDFDGIADVKSFYEQGKLVRQELDLNHDGKPDVLQHFEAGKLVRSERIEAEPENKADAQSDAKNDAKNDNRPAGQTPVTPPPLRASAPVPMPAEEKPAMPGESTSAAPASSMPPAPAAGPSGFPGETLPSLR